MQAKLIMCHIYWGEDFYNVQLLCWHCCYFCQIGELIGGSQREERIEYLENRLDELKLNKDSFWWYLDLRRYGTGKYLYLYLYLFPMFKSFSSSLLLTLPHFPPQFCTWSIITIIFMHFLFLLTPNTISQILFCSSKQGLVLDNFCWIHTYIYIYIVVFLKFCSSTCWVRVRFWKTCTVCDGCRQYKRCNTFPSYTRISWILMPAWHSIASLNCYILSSSNSKTQVILKGRTSGRYLYCCIKFCLD